MVGDRLGRILEAPTPRVVPFLTVTWSARAAVGGALDAPVPRFSASISASVTPSSRFCSGIRMFLVRHEILFHHLPDRGLLCSLPNQPESLGRGGRGGKNPRKASLMLLFRVPTISGARASPDGRSRADLRPRPERGVKHDVLPLATAEISCAARRTTFPGFAGASLKIPDPAQIAPCSAVGSLSCVLKCCPSASLIPKSLRRVGAKDIIGFGAAMGATAC